MTVSREDIAGSPLGVVSRETYDKSISSVIGGGSVDYADHSAPALDTTLTVLGWEGMRVTETYRSLSADSWRSRVTVRAAAIDLMERRLGKRHVFVSAGYVTGLSSALPLDQADLVEIHEKGGDQQESADAWTASGIVQALCDIIGTTVVLSVLDYTVSIAEFDENATIMDAIQQLFGMYQPRIVFLNGSFVVIDRLYGSLGGTAVVNDNALVVDQRESRETIPSKVKVVGGSTSRSKFLVEKQVSTYREAVCEQTFSWEGYGTTTLNENHESETEKVQITNKYGLDSEGNRQFLVRTDRVTWERREMSSSTGRGGGAAVEGGRWVKIREETAFHKYSRTSNLWEAPRLDFTVECMWQMIWEQTGEDDTENAEAYVDKPINAVSGWTFSKYGDKAVSYTFHRYVWGDTPITTFLSTSSGDNLHLDQIGSAGGSSPMDYQPAPDGFTHFGEIGPPVPIEPDSFAVFGGSMGNPQDVNPDSFAVFGGAVGGITRSTSSSGTGGDYLRAEIISHKAVLISKAGDKIVFPDGSRCYLPAFKVDRFQLLTSLAMFFDTGSSSRGVGSGSSGSDGLAGGDAGGSSTIGGAVPGGFSDDFFDQFGKINLPVWGSEIILYEPMTKDTHAVYYHSVYYDESIDYGEANNVSIETGFQMVGSENPKSPLKKARSLGSWTIPMESEDIALGGTGSTITIHNASIATKEDAQKIAERIALIYGRGYKQFTTVRITADLVPEVGWAVSGGATHPNGPTVTIGDNGFLAGFTKSKVASSSERIVELTVESDVPSGAP